MAVSYSVMVFNFQDEVIHTSPKSGEVGTKPGVTVLLLEPAQPKNRHRINTRSIKSILNNILRQEFKMHHNAG